MTLQIGDKAPNFSMPTDGNGTTSLSDYAGQTLILYFYPKDDTSGCTAQACAFTDNMAGFNAAKCAVLGVSKDTVKKHDAFKAKYNLNFSLASDAETQTCENYGVWVEKSMYGRKYMGIERTTFLIDGNGIIQKIWNKVKVNGHIEDVLATVKNYDSKAA